MRIVTLSKESRQNLLDSLFEDTAWDVATDISVLQTMLAQEGLTEPGMKAGS